MNRSSSDDGDSPAVMADGYPKRPEHRPASSAAGSANTVAARPPIERPPCGRRKNSTTACGVSAPIRPDYVSTAPTRPDRRRRPRRHGPLLAKVAVLLAVAALAAWLLPAFVAQSFAVPGGAMSPTLQAGDRILVAKSGLLEAPIRTGQIVVFRPPQFLPCTVVGGDGDLVLRVIALPGQTIWSIDNTIFVDGRPLRERGWYDPRFGQVGSRPIPSTTLAQNQYFVMGDNRSGACDSRVFGPISGSSIVGEGIAIVVRHGHVFLRKL